MFVGANKASLLILMIDFHKFVLYFNRIGYLMYYETNQYKYLKENIMTSLVSSWNNYHH